MIAANPKEANDGVGSAILSKVYRAVASTLAASLEGQPEQDFAQPSDKIAFGSSRERRFR